MSNSTNVIDQLIPITLFNKGKASKIFERLTKENKLIVLKNNQPSAVLLSPKEYSRLLEIEEDYRLLVEANKRLENPKYVSYEDALDKLGIEEAELMVSEDAEIL